MLKRNYFLFFTFLLIFFTLAGCNTNKKNDDGLLSIYTTVYPLQDFTEKIGGDYVNVKTIYPPGADEHTFEPSQKDMIDMANGELFFYIGHGLEGFVEKAKRILENEGVKIIAIGEQIDIENAEEHEEESEHEEHDGHHHGSVDPHIWIDPIYAKEMAKIIKDALVEAMPEQKDYFDKNYNDLAIQFDNLDQEFQQLALSGKHKEFLVSHAAYSYWEHRYDLEQLSISGVSTTDEPSQKKLAAIINEVKEHQLKYILVEQNVTNRLTDIIRDEANLTELPIHNLSVLTKENIQNKDDYFSLMRQNIESLKTALNN